jgi:hypothetical protein
VTRTNTTRLIAERLPSSNNRKTSRLALKSNLTQKEVFAFFIEDANALKRQLQLKPEKTAISNKSTKEG